MEDKKDDNNLGVPAEYLYRDSEINRSTAEAARQHCGAPILRNTAAPLPAYGTLDQITFEWRYDFGARMTSGARAQNAGVAIAGKEVLLSIDFHRSLDDGGPGASWWDWAVEDDAGSGRGDVASGIVWVGDVLDAEAEAKRRAETMARMAVGVPILEVGAIDAVIAAQRDQIPENLPDLRWDAPSVRGILLRAARALRKAARQAAGTEGSSCHDRSSKT